MPFRHLFRQQQSSHDFHSQHVFQGQHNQLAIVDPDSIDCTGWHEMDFTTTPLTSPTDGLDAQYLNRKYSATMEVNQDPPTYMRSTNQRQRSTGSLISASSERRNTGSRRSSGDIYPGNQFSFSQLLDMEANLSPLEQSSLSSSRPDDYSNMTNNEYDLTTTLSASDSVNASPPMSNLNPITISIASRPDSTERLCPLIAGQVDSCQPSRCGPDAPCMNFTTLPPIEECTSVPCITGSTSPSDTMINNDGTSVGLRNRPNMSTKKSTTTTSRSSAIRHSSSSSATTGEAVPLPPRKHTTTTPRRQTRANLKSISIPVNAAASSDNDDDNEEYILAATKRTAPSKADAKQRAKQAHSLVERKYRENLNGKINQLHTTLQNSHYGPRLGDDSNEHEDLASNNGVLASKVRKSDVLTEAMNYVNQTEVEMRHMETEINRLNVRVRVLEKLVRCEDCSLLKQMVGLQVQLQAR